METFHCIILLLPLFCTKSTTAAALNTHVCDHTKDLYDKYGYYINSMCYIEEKRTNAGAATFCKVNGMRLFTITDEIVQGAFIDMAGKTFGTNNNFIFWISGKNGPRYVDTNDGQTPLFSVPEIFIYPGDCVAIGSVGTFYYDIMSYPCNDNLPIICEFENAEIVATFDGNPRLLYCDFTKDLYDSEGNYMKSTCWHDAHRTNQEAAVFCRKNNMQLFTIRSEEERQALFASSERAFGVKGQTSIWISGINSPRYVDSNDRTTELPSPALPTDRVGGYCVAVASLSDPHYLLIDLNCNRKQAHYCEWENHNPEPEKD